MCKNNRAITCVKGYVHPLYLRIWIDEVSRLSELLSSPLLSQNSDNGIFGMAIGYPGCQTNFTLAWVGTSSPECQTTTKLSHCGKKSKSKPSLE